jgi:hypothetical protein|tara:strand:- start:155 stop:967 length:813 start_codon:yes stop_codon:yes gene_type:complete
MKFNLYDESKIENFNSLKIKNYLKKKFDGIHISLFKDLMNIGQNEESLDDLSKELAKIRILNPNEPFHPNEPMHGELNFEKRVILQKTSPIGVFYDGFRLQKLYWKLIPKKQRSLDFAHIIFTERFFGTFENNDSRYHGRVILLGYPTLISTTGLIEAPAKPKEFYLGSQLGRDREEMKELIEGRFIDYGDKRITDILKGYVLQGIFYQMLGDTFCESKVCRLFNSHWQEEVINSQMQDPEFCEKHVKRVSYLKEIINPHSQTNLSWNKL